MMAQFLLAFPLLLWSLQGVASCLHCDRRFLDSVATLLKETLPADLSGRDTLMERHIEEMADLHGTYLQNNYERVLDVRGVASIKSDIINQLREIKKQPWKGVFIWQLSMYHLRVSLRKHMKQTLERFADLACSEDCSKYEHPQSYCSPESSPLPLFFQSAYAASWTGIGHMPRPGALPSIAVTEGPILDCWTCLRIAAQCFDGELCGVEDERMAEHKEIILYVFLVCESVLISSAVLIYLVCFKHKKKMLKKALAR